jgi:IclR family transcriptional regulator, acetate operon repressor
MRKIDMKIADSVAVLDKAMDLLEKLAEEANQSVADLSDATGISKATAYRILHTLEKRGYVVTYERVKRYSIGHAFHVYMQAARDGDRLLEAARPEMRSLLDALGETVNLGVLARQGVLYLEVLESGQSLRATSEIGTFDTLHSTALGKAMLSRMPRQERDTLLAEAKLVQRTEHTVTDPEKVREVVEMAARLGHAIDDEENEIGMRCVAAPIVNADGRPLAAISVSGPSSRMTRATIERTCDLLLSATARISEALTRA